MGGRAAQALDVAPTVVPPEQALCHRLIPHLGWGLTFTAPLLPGILNATPLPSGHDISSAHRFFIAFPLG